MLTSKENTIDGVFFSRDHQIFTKEEIENFVKSGYICELSQYMKETSNIKYWIEQFEEYNFLETIMIENGIYYMPTMDTARKARNSQVLWINMGWIQKLNLKIPQTAQDLRRVLEAFYYLDPNNNGLQDEIPLVSCEADYSLQSYQYLLNAFTYNNPWTNRFYIDENDVMNYAPDQEAFWMGIDYCA